MIIFFFGIQLQHLLYRQFFFSKNTRSSKILLKREKMYLKKKLKHSFSHYY